MEHFITIPAFLICVVTKISTKIAFILQIFINHTFQAIFEILGILLLVNFRVSNCFLNLLLSIFPVFIFERRTSTSVYIAPATSHLADCADPMKIALCGATKRLFADIALLDDRPLLLGMVVAYFGADGPPP